MGLFGWFAWYAFVASVLTFNWIGVLLQKIQPKLNLAKDYLITVPYICFSPRLYKAYV